MQHVPGIAEFIQYFQSERVDLAFRMAACGKGAEIASAGIVERRAIIERALLPVQRKRMLRVIQGTFGNHEAQCAVATSQPFLAW